MRDTILFDLDGTLVDSAQGIAVAIDRLRAEHGLRPLDVAAVRPLVALGAETLVARALEGQGSDPHRDIVAFRAHLRDVPADPASIYPGVPEALAALAARGLRLGW